MKKIVIGLCIATLLLASCKSSKDCGCPYPVSSSIAAKPLPDRV